MKLLSIVILSIIFLSMGSFTYRKDDTQKLAFCDGIKMVHQAFKDGNWSKVKGLPRVGNQYVYSSLIDIDELSDEYIDGVTGTAYNGTYKKVSSAEEQKEVMAELAAKLENCLGKKAKKAKINGYEIKIGKVTFKVMNFGRTAVLLSIWDFKD